MRQNVSAAVAAAEEELCEACVHSAGLCISHVPDVCPQLRQPSWHRDAHRGALHNGDPLEQRLEIPTPDVEKDLARVERREARRTGPKCYDRFSAHRVLGAINGGFSRTISRPRRRAAAA